jgi:FSR family fosmidomycin resistance protein-like MFS transporter
LDTEPCNIDTSQRNVGLDAERDSVDKARFQSGQVLSLSLAHALHDTYTGFLPPLLPLFIASLSLSNSAAGLLTVFIQLPSLAQPLVGHIADSVNLQYLIVAGPAVTALLMSLLGLAPSYLALAVLLVLAGLSSASFHAVGSAMAGESSGRALGRGLGWWMVGGELGRALGPVLIATVVTYLTLDGTPWLILPGIAGSVALWLCVRNRLVRSTREAQVSDWAMVARGLCPVLLPLAGITATRGFTVAALATYLPTFLTLEGANLWVAGASLTIVEAAGVAGVLLMGWLSDKIGRSRVLILCMVSLPFLMLFFLWSADMARFPLMVAVGLVGLSQPPVMMALVQESYPSYRALANGVYLSMNFVLRSAAVVAVGALADVLGMRMAFTISAIVPVLGVPFLLMFNHNRPPVEQAARRAVTP